MRTHISYDRGRLSVQFPGHEPMNFWDKEEVVELIIVMCDARHKAWPERPKQVTIK